MNKTVNTDNWDMQ